MPNHYFRIAKEQEEKAKDISENSKDKSEIMNAFEDAGNSFANAGFENNAKENYSKAFIYAKTKSDKTRIENKIKKLRTPISQKEKVFRELEKIK